VLALRSNMLEQVTTRCRCTAATRIWCCTRQCSWFGCSFETGPCGRLTICAQPSGSFQGGHQGINPDILGSAKQPHAAPSIPIVPALDSQQLANHALRFQDRTDRGKRLIVSRATWKKLSLLKRETMPDMAFLNISTRLMCGTLPDAISGLQWKPLPCGTSQSFAACLIFMMTGQWCLLLHLLLKGFSRWRRSMILN
jgi:hypothetical protein